MGVDPRCLAQLISMGIDKAVALKALQQSNNDVSAALDAVTTLTQKNKDHVELDDLSLCSLLSLGFDEEKAEAALRAVGGNDVERALHLLNADDVPTPNVSIEAAGIDNPEDKITDAKDGADADVVIWQFEQDLDCWLSYPREASDVVEATYQRWRSGGTLSSSHTGAEACSGSLVQVHCGNWVYEVDVAAYTQRNVQHHSRRTRRIRRHVVAIGEQGEEFSGPDAKKDDKTAIHAAARELVERELGNCLRHRDVEADIAGAPLTEELNLVRKFLGP